MKKEDALRQLCKMQGEIAGRLELETLCVCDDPKGLPKTGDVPDKVIEEMWRRLTDQRLEKLRKLAAKWRKEMEMAGPKTWELYAVHARELLEVLDG